MASTNKDYRRARKRLRSLIAWFFIASVQAAWVFISSMAFPPESASSSVLSRVETIDIAILAGEFIAAATATLCLLRTTSSTTCTIGLAVVFVATGAPLAGRLLLLFAIARNYNIYGIVNLMLVLALLSRAIIVLYLHCQLRQLPSVLAKRRSVATTTYLWLGAVVANAGLEFPSVCAVL